jgi:hypothetical protein
MGIGGFYNTLSDRFTDDAGTFSRIALEDYSGIELFYSAAITPAIHLTGDLQIINGSRSATETAIVPRQNI